LRDKGSITGEFEEFFGLWLVACGFGQEFAGSMIGAIGILVFVVLMGWSLVVELLLVKWCEVMGLGLGLGDGCVIELSELTGFVVVKFSLDPLAPCMLAKYVLHSF
jgi:hypothetical protein